MSRIKREVAAFIADHRNNHFVMTPVTMREVSLRTAQEQMLPKVEMEISSTAFLMGARPILCRSEFTFPIRVGSAGFDLLPWRRLCHRYRLGL